VAEHGKSSSDGSPRRAKDAVQEFPHRHACVSSALIPHRPSEPTGDAREDPGSGHYHQPIAMTESPSQRSGFAEEPARHTEPDAPGAGDRIGSLRGASVEFDRRRAGHVIVGVFTVAGVHSNNHTDELHDHGVPVTVTVTGCLGLLGGSGSNAAGYACHGTYVLDGRRSTVSLPGTSFHRPGSTIPSLAVPDDPALVSPDSVIDHQHSSAGVFVLPAVLGAILLALIGVIVWRYRARRGVEPAGMLSEAPTARPSSGSSPDDGAYVGGV
jgi:hypothetical protein